MPVPTNSGFESKITGVSKRVPLTLLDTGNCSVKNKTNNNKKHNNSDVNKITTAGLLFFRVSLYIYAFVVVVVVLIQPLYDQPWQH